MKRLFIISIILVALQSLSAFNPTFELSLIDTSFTGESGVTVAAQLGYLEVPENRENPSSQKISLKFIKLKSTNPNPGTPIIYLEGGPGSSCTWQAGQPYYLDGWRKYLELGDVILVDQRGTGEASQRLTYIWMNELPDDIFVSAENAQNHFAKVYSAAIKAYDERGIDLRGYTTKQNAEDIDALREALGYEKVTIMGFSYGTHLGLAYIRYFSENIENAVLIGTEGPNHTFKLPSSMDSHLGKVALMAKNDQELSQDVPDLVGLYKEVVAQLEAEPAVVTVTNPLTRKEMEVKVGPFGLQVVMRLDIGDASDLPVFPRLLYSIKQKDYSMLEWFIRKRFNMVLGTQGMATTMDLASGASEDRMKRILQEEKESLFPQVANMQLYLTKKMDGVWPNPDLGKDFRTPLISDVRTLFMSGTLDFNTPPYQAEEVRWGFSNSSHIIVKHAGHEQVLTHPGAVPAVLSFLKGENVDEIGLAYPPLEFIPVKGKAEGHPSIK